MSKLITMWLKMVSLPPTWASVHIKCFIFKFHVKNAQKEGILFNSISKGTSQNKILIFP